MSRSVGLFIIVAGACLIGIGILTYAGALNWFGRLPGDIRYEGTNTRIYFPIVSLILISLAINIIAYLVRKFL